MKKYIIFFIFVLHVGYACDCGYNTNSLIENYNSFNAVFKGKVVSIEYIETNNKKYDQITFSVFKNFKGAENKQIIVYEDSYSNCSIKFNIGEEWIVWGNIWNGQLSTNWCTPTVNLKKIEEDGLKLLENIADTKGYKVWYDERGSKIAEGNLVNNLADGYWKYYKYGFLNSEGLYNNGLKEGKWTSYYESYFYQITIDDKNKDVVNDLLNGKNAFFRRISTVVNYQKGKMNGEYINYHFSGKIKYISVYKENQLNGTSVAYGKNERPESIHSYKNDKLDGMWISFFEVGTIELLCYYREGKKFGDWDLFDEEGKIRCSSKNGDTFPEFSKGRYYCKRD